MSNTLSTDNLPTQNGSGSGGQRRLLVIVGGAALALVVALGAYFLFLSGGEEEDLGPVPSGAAAVDESDGKGKDGGNGKDGKDGKDDDVIVGVDDDFTVGRDPFAPLAAEEVEAAPEPAADDTTTDTSGVDTGNDTGGTPDPAPAPAPAPTPTPTPTPTDDAVTSWKVTLRSVDVAKDSAVIEVNGKRYVVEVGDRFASKFKLTRVAELPSGDTATVRFGSADPVELVAKDTEVFKLS